ncbi:MAG: hypothetical protein HY695_15665 [Deltaproteobacteria bacterium]|nr:hypothetical protein [Deltaproteobacteria bacterium]
MAGSDGCEKLTDGIRILENDGVSYLDGDLSRARTSFSSVPLMTYDYDSGLARGETIIATVKTTVQIHKNDRQVEQLKRPRPDVFGRESARQYVYGFVAAFPLSHDRLNWDLAESEWAFSALEPYAVDARRGRMALAGANYVRLVDMETAKEAPFRHPWLSQVHTVQFSADGKRLLVASSGFDAILEFDTQSGEVIWEWFAWEHGFDRAMLGHHVVRSPEQREALTALGREVILVEDPLKFEFGVATRLIPAHLNSARYDGDGRILASLFHQGAGIIIDRVTGEVRQVISGLVNPHKLSRRRDGGYFISDTRRGKLVLIDEDCRSVSEIALAGLSGIERPELISEFLQNTTELRKDLFACVDIHRNSIWIVDVKRRKYRGIKFPLEWSMHDIARVRQEDVFRIGQLVGTVFSKVEALEEEERKLIRHFSADGRAIATVTLDAQGRAIGLDVVM